MVLIVESDHTFTKAKRKYRRRSGIFGMAEPLKTPLWVHERIVPEGSRIMTGMDGGRPIKMSCFQVCSVFPCACSNVVCTHVLYI